jgi:hypothetical protein
VRVFTFFKASLVSFGLDRRTVQLTSTDAVLAGAMGQRKLAVKKDVLDRWRD